MKRYIPVSRVEGKASRQAHCDLPAGTYEREMSKEGFFGPAAFFYHRHPPTGWSDFRGRCGRARSTSTTWRPTRPGRGPRRRSCENAHCRLRYWRLPGRMSRLARNADGDELLFVHAGAADLYCDFGHLAVTAGDYVVLPRGTMWRLETAAPVDALLIEATNASYMLPDKGLLGGHAIFDPAMLDTPRIDEQFLAQQNARETWQVEVKRRNELSTITYPYNPLDAVGWHGELAPVRINVRDLRPVMSHRYHLPPSVHTTFLSNRFVVCTFVPRPFETDPGAIKVPFFHNNDDYDEVIFYHAGDFFSRDNIRPGMMTFHPGGFTHGPHPKALARMFEQTKPAHRRVRRDGRCARPAGRGGSGRGRRVGGLRRQLEAGRGARTLHRMKLATLRDGTRDGRLVVVSSDLARAVAATSIAGCMQDALDEWSTCAPQLQMLFRTLEAGRAADVFDFDPAEAMAPLPRAHHWVDGSAYVNHVELVRKARGAEMPPSFWTEPLMYQGGSDDLLGAARTTCRSRARSTASTSRPRSPSLPTTCRWAPDRPRRAPTFSC